MKFSFSKWQRISQAFKKNSSRIFLCLLFTVSFHSLYGFDEIKSLDYSDSSLIQLRAEITENLKKSKSHEPVQIIWRTYKVKKNDNFFLIMARTMQNQDTLASVNRLTSLWDISEGQQLLIPNVRGITVYGQQAEIAERYKIPTKLVLPLPDISFLDSKERRYLVAGKLFSPDQRNYFNLSIFIRPVEGRVSSPYGYRNDPFTNKKKFHKGVDIACPMNSPVKAAATGTVVATGEGGGYGRYIILRHRNDYVTLYGHLNTILVKQGQKVSQGSLIARSGNTGRSTGPHLHFEVRRSGKTTLPRFQHQ